MTEASFRYRLHYGNDIKDKNDRVRMLFTSLLTLSAYLRGSEAGNWQWYTIEYLNDGGGWHLIGDGDRRNLKPRRRTK